MRSAKQPPDKGPTLGLPEILSAAQAEAVRLGKLKKWHSAFREAAPDPPLLVARLDQPGVYYYVAPFRIGARLTGRLCIDAHTGRYEEATGVTKPGAALSRYWTTEDVWQRLILPTPSRRTGGKRVPMVGTVIEPMLVWRQSMQSRSPFLPFHLARTGKKVRYYRVDGLEFDDLFPAAGT